MLVCLPVPVPSAAPKVSGVNPEIPDADERILRSFYGTPSLNPCTSFRSHVEVHRISPLSLPQLPLPVPLQLALQALLTIQVSLRLLTLGPHPKALHRIAPQCQSPGALLPPALRSMNSFKDPALPSSTVKGNCFAL